MKLLQVEEIDKDNFLLHFLIYIIILYKNCTIPYQEFRICRLVSHSRLGVSMNVVLPLRPSVLLSSCVLKAFISFS